MACKFALVVFCLFVVGYVDAAGTDLWTLLSASDKFQLISRTYMLGNNECAYMKVKSREQSKHTLDVLMGYRDGTTKEYKGPGSYTVTVSGSQMTVTVQGYTSDGITYNLEYSDGQGCNILKGAAGGQRGGECELWAPEGQESHAQGTSCKAQFESTCATAVQHPYQSDCTIP
ncbi:allergen Arg r 1-like [Ornithodoros turicata]|uniref:Putative salivary secreted lipocalin n=1 Tax=Ornithodoros turicata TaxID=34597 RepID=A0A2R5L4N4_9ACAR